MALYRFVGYGFTSRYVRHLVCHWCVRYACSVATCQSAYAKTHSPRSRLGGCARRRGGRAVAQWQNVCRVERRACAYVWTRPAEAEEFMRILSSVKQTKELRARSAEARIPIRPHTSKYSKQTNKQKNRPEARTDAQDRTRKQTKDNTRARGHESTDGRTRGKYRTNHKVHLGCASHLSQP